MLEAAPGLRPIAIFEEMQRRHPELPEGVRRTMERRIRQWRALNGQDRDVIFRQVQEPGHMSKGRAGQRSEIVTPITKSPSDWIDKEVAGCHFADARLANRFRSLLARLAESPGESIPLACQDWANTKAAYRFFDNERVSEADILAGHWQATRERFRATDGPVLVLHDTSEFSYQCANIDAIGKTRTGVSFAPRAHRPQKYTVCGMLMHSSLIVTPEGLPLGLAAIKFWTRPKFKGANELKRHINPTRVPIEKKESISMAAELASVYEASRRSQALCAHR